jgi:hypothetical protein
MEKRIPANDLGLVRDSVVVDALNHFKVAGITMRLASGEPLH